MDFLQGVPKKTWFKRIFEFFTLKGVFLGVKNNSIRTMGTKNIGLISKIFSKLTLFFSHEATLELALSIRASNRL